MFSLQPVIVIRSVQLVRPVTRRLDSVHAKMVWLASPATAALKDTSKADHLSPLASVRVIWLVCYFSYCVFKKKVFINSWCRKSTNEWHYPLKSLALARYIYFKKLTLLLSKDALYWSKVKAKALMLRKIYSN